MTVINTNVSAAIATNSLMRNEKSMTTSMERLSTGLRINAAKDDAAGMAIASRMTSQITGLNQAMRNANDGISLLQTAEGAISEVTAMLQRMRELAVQSASAIYDDADRTTLDAEVQQLKAEIDSIAANTTFNGKALLSGAFGTQSLQVGYQSGQTLDVKMANISSTAIGGGEAAAVTAFGDVDTGTTGAGLETANDLSAGDLVINGISIRGSVDDDDDLSVYAKSASAIAAAAAINASTDETGVVATVGETTKIGGAMTAAALTGSVTINGITTASITTTTDAAASRVLIVDAINLISEATGVTAADTGDSNGGVTLTAADGRNISVALTTITAAASGLVAGTQSGTYSLRSTDSSDITISSAKADSAAALEKAGLRSGTYSGTLAAVSSGVRTAVTAAPGTTSGILQLGDLTINGSIIAGALAADDTASDATAAGSEKGASAIALAAAINKSSEDTGVTATANANVVIGNSTFTATTASVFINNVDTGAGLTTDTRATVAARINNFTGQTGVSAADNGVGLTFTAADGRNIAIGGTNTSAGLSSAQVGAQTAVDTTTARVHYASVTLSSSAAFTIARGSNASTSMTAIGFTAGTYGGETSGSKISDIEITTSALATSALESIDNALESVSAARGELGALENRLGYTVNNLTSMVSNTAASRSRIEDADYAKETTELARTQIIAQAGTAMLAQANQVKQTVLSLLQ